MTLDAHAFRINVSDAVLDDLHRRLDHVRWPIEPVAEAWRYGTDAAYLRVMIDHWRHRYVWRAQEARLNRFRQYRLPVQDMHLHVLVEPGSGPSPCPLLLLNGWPSCFTEFADIIDPLAHPERFGGDAADGFTVIIPSYPGFGFSDPPLAPIGARMVAAVLLTLVQQIVGSARFMVHGGDWGAIIGSWMAFDAPDRVSALHVNAAPLCPPFDAATLDKEEKAFLAARTEKLVGALGYQAIQSTKPQSLSYGLTDSPVGLAGWILEKYHGWEKTGNGDPPPFDPDVLLTIVMIYWLNGINAANWLYCDLVSGDATTLPPGGRIAVPTMLVTGGRDLGLAPPPQWVRRSYNLVKMCHLPDMGHFPAMEPVAPTQVAHMREFFQAYRRTEKA